MSSSLEDEKRVEQKNRKCANCVAFDCGVETRCGVQRRNLGAQFDEKKRRESGAVTLKTQTSRHMKPRGESDLDQWQTRSRVIGSSVGLTNCDAVGRIWSKAAQNDVISSGGKAHGVM
jgi:hypothetical protein